MEQTSPWHGIPVHAGFCVRFTGKKAAFIYLERAFSDTCARDMSNPQIDVFMREIVATPATTPADMACKARVALMLDPGPTDDRQATTIDIICSLLRDIVREHARVIPITRTNRTAPQLWGRSHARWSCRRKRSTAVPLLP